MTVLSPLKLLNLAYMAKRWDPEQPRWPSKAPHGHGGQWMRLDQVAAILGLEGGPSRIDLGFVVKDAPHIDGLEVRKIPAAEDGRPHHERGLRYAIKLKAGRVRATVYIDDWNGNKGDFGKKLDALKKTLGNLDEGQMPGEAVEGNFQLKVAGKHKQFREALNAEANIEAQAAGAGAEDRMPPEVAKWPLFPVEQAKVNDTVYIHQPEIGIVHERFKLTQAPEAVQIGGEPFARLYRDNGPPFVVPMDRGILIKPPPAARAKMLQAAAKILDRQPEGRAFTARLKPDGPHVRVTKTKGVWTTTNGVPYRTDVLVEALENADSLVNVIEVLQRQERQDVAARVEPDWRVAQPEQVEIGDRVQDIDGSIFEIEQIEEVPGFADIRFRMRNVDTGELITMDRNPDADAFDEWIPAEEVKEELVLDNEVKMDVLLEGAEAGARAPLGAPDLDMQNIERNELGVAGEKGAQISAASLRVGDEVLLDDLWMPVDEINPTDKGNLSVMYRLPNGVRRNVILAPEVQVRARPPVGGPHGVGEPGGDFPEPPVPMMRQQVPARLIQPGMYFPPDWLNPTWRKIGRVEFIGDDVQFWSEDGKDLGITSGPNLLDVGIPRQEKPLGSRREAMKQQLQEDLADFPVNRITKRPGGGLNAYFDDGSDAINAAQHLRDLGYQAEVRPGGRVAVKEDPKGDNGIAQVVEAVPEVPVAQGGVAQPAPAAPARRRGRAPQSARKALGERARDIVGGNVKAVRKRPNGGVIMRLQVNDRAAAKEAKEQLEAAGMRARIDYDAKRERILIIFGPQGEAVNGPNEPKGGSERLKGRVTDVRRLGGGINETKKGTLESTGETVVIKTESGLHRMGQGRDLDRERAAYLIAEELQADGFDIVVPQVEINEGNVKGVRGRALVYEFIRGKTGDGARGGKDDFPGGRELRIFDYMINNTDRHGGNWMVRDEDNHVVAIDNGLTFWAHNRHAPDERRALDYMNPEHEAAVKKFYARRAEIQEKVGHLTAQEWEDFWSRIGLIADTEARGEQRRKAREAEVAAARATVERRQKRLEKAIEDQRKLEEIDLDAHFGAAEARRLKNNMRDRITKIRQTIKDAEAALRRAEGR